MSEILGYLNTKLNCDTENESNPTEKIKTNSEKSKKIIYLATEATAWAVQNLKCKCGWVPFGECVRSFQELQRDPWTIRVCSETKKWENPEMKNQNPRNSEQTHFHIESENSLKMWSFLTSTSKRETFLFCFLCVRGFL